jgi:hypothetical protein
MEAVDAGAFQIDSYSETSKMLTRESAGKGFASRSRHAYATIRFTNLAATLRRWFIERPRQRQLTTPGRAPQERHANRVAEQPVYC